MRVFFIIGDSNLNRMTNSPVDNVRVECFPGVRITHINQILGKLEGRRMPQPDYVILSVGINDRTNNTTPTSVPGRRKLVARAARVLPRSRIVIPEINYPDHLPVYQKRNLKTLNDSLHKLPLVTTIPRRDMDKFRTEEADIHWTVTIGNSILAHWISHLNG